MVFKHIGVKAVTKDLETIEERKQNK